MTDRTFEGHELRDYWRALHSFAGEMDERTDPEFLAIVCHPGAPAWFNEFVAATQERAFGRAVEACGTVDGRSVLEIGCGRGRWSRILRDAGGSVVAVDVSPEAIESNRKRITGVTFVERDIVDLGFRDDSFDLALSVTVLQHLLPDEQQRATAEIGRLVRPGGHFLLMENIRDRGRHVFARTIDGWSKLLAQYGFVLVRREGYSYDLPLRLLERARSAVRGEDAADPSLSRGADFAARTFGRPVNPSRRAYQRSVLLPTVLAARLLEPISAALLPDAWATHCALVFKRVDHLAG